jgi:Ca2+-binding EF-hand superfamily protein
LNLIFSGKIPEAEMLNVLHTLAQCLNLGEEEIQEILQKFDTDKDGSIDFEGTFWF